MRGRRRTRRDDTRRAVLITITFAVAIGALLACMHVLTLADMETALNNHMPGRHKNLLPKNVEALSRGAAREVLVKLTLLNWEKTNLQFDQNANAIPAPYDNI